MEEAANIDGASTWKTYWTIIFPMMKPMHATVAVLTALGTWNDVMTPLVIMVVFTTIVTPILLKLVFPKKKGGDKETVSDDLTALEKSGINTGLEES